MKTILLLLCFWLSVQPFCVAETPSDRLLKELDKTLRERKVYEDEKERQIQSLKELLKHTASDEQRFSIYGRLFDEYLSYETDSAMYYARRRMEIGEKTGKPDEINNAAMNVANVMGVTGMYKGALDILNDIRPRTLPPDLLKYYYQLYRTVYGAMTDYSADSGEKEIYGRLTDLYRDSLLGVYDPGSQSYIIVKADQLIVHGKCGEALDLLLERLPEITSGSHDMAIMAYSVADAYGCLGNRAEEKKYLILSSLADIKSSVKEYVSLRKLSDVLFQEGDIDRAYDYLRFSLGDAISSNARLRTFEISRIFPLIEDTWQQKTEKQQDQLIVLLVAISILAFFLVLAVVYVYRQMRRLSVARRELDQANLQLKQLNTELHSSNDQLVRLNQVLSEANNIKEEYIGRYMDFCLSYLDKMDNYRRMLNKTAAAGKVEDLYKAIKSTQFIEDELKEFYANFDETFLRIFPHFIEDINALLKPEGQLLPKQGEKLSTELRIYALIRLGITDSNRIAHFLRYSVTTIYNYRTKIRNNASGIRDEFEEKVIRIGLI